MNEKGIEDQGGKNAEISHTEKSGIVVFHNLNLTAENPISPEIEVSVKKKSIEIIEGESYGGNCILIDKETKKMKSLLEKAEELLEIPEIERPKKILEILRDKIDYAFDEAMDRLSKTDPELAKWVAENTGLNSSAHNVPMSELLEKGYGICRHLSVAYLWLAQKAGLKGVLLNCPYGTIKNIERTDSKEKLFKSADIGQPVSAHSWVEIQTSDGKWIPIDPSTKLVGDSEESLAMFKDANYIANANMSLEAQAEPTELWRRGGQMSFVPAEPTATTTYSLELRSARTIHRFGKENIPPTNTPYSGDGTLNLSTETPGTKYDGLGLEIVGIKEK